MAFVDNRNGIEVALRSWAAWAPGLPDPLAWQEWAAGERSVDDEGKPDVAFVEPLLRRRLSTVSRMAFRVATDCLDGQPTPDSFVFCSRYGEFKRAYDILNDLCEGNEASAAAFSNSVHNTAVSQFAIHRQERGPSNFITGNDATLETACVHAWSLLATGAAQSVLVVYHDAPLPPLYRGQPTSIHHGIALAFLLEPVDRAAEDSLRLRLDWDDQPVDAPASAEEGVLRVFRHVLGGRGPVAIDAGRLTWHWSADHAAH